MNLLHWCLPEIRKQHAVGSHASCVSRDWFLSTADHIIAVLSEDFTQFTQAGTERSCLLRADALPGSQRARLC